MLTNINLVKHYYNLKTQKITTATESITKQTAKQSITINMTIYQCNKHVLFIYLMATVLIKPKQNYTYVNKI